jgi:hypothetical protein
MMGVKLESMRQSSTASESRSLRRALRSLFLRSSLTLPLHRDRLKLKSFDYFWLSTTPSVPGSKDWDAGQTRMVTVAHFSPLASDSDDFYALCTHWDDRGLLSRTKAAEIILDYVSKLGAEGKLVVLLGDLNSPAEEDGYRTLTHWKYAKGKDQAGSIAFSDTRLELAVARVGEKAKGGESLLHR